MSQHITRREFIVKPAIAAAGLAATGLLTQCAPQTEVVKETVVVEKEVEKEVTTVPKVKESITLTYNTWWPLMADKLVPVIPIFEERFPHVKIEQQVLPYDEWVQKYQTTMVAGTAPDTFCGNSFISPKFYDPKYHLELSEALAADGIDIQRDYSLMGTELWCGDIYAMPFDLDPNAIFYNKTMVKEYYGKDIWEDMDGKWDLDDWLEIMIACTQDTNGDGRIDQWGAGGHLSNREVWCGSMSYTRGGHIFDFHEMKYTFADKIAMDTCKMGYDWWMKHHVFIPPDESEVMTSAGIGIPFAGGVCATHYRAVADLPAFVDQVGDKFEWDCVLLPGATKDKPGVALISGNPNLVYAGTKHRDEAYEWVKFLAGEDTQEYFAREGICVPSLTRMQSLFKEYPGVEHAYIFAEVPQNDYHIHMRHFNALECRSIIDSRMDEIYIAGADFEGTITAMNDEINELVEYGDCLPYAGWQHPIPGGQELK